MESHPELVTSGVNPLLHYVLYGDHDKRSQTGADQDRYSA